MAASTGQGGAQDGVQDAPQATEGGEAQRKAVVCVAEQAAAQSGSGVVAPTSWLTARERDNPEAPVAAAAAASAPRDAGSAPVNAL
jgi:hypothetical protein